MGGEKAVAKRLIFAFEGVGRRIVVQVHMYENEQHVGQERAVRSVGLTSIKRRVLVRVERSTVHPRPPLPEAYLVPDQRKQQYERYPKQQIDVLSILAQQQRDKLGFVFLHEHTEEGKSRCSTLILSFPP